jgi:hypothetical protein
MIEDGMKRSLLFFLLVTCTTPARAAFLFHADGQILEGKIVKQTAMSVTFKVKNQKPRLINGYDIIRIREKLTITRGVTVFDRARGILFTSNIVDASESKYVFRKDFDKPDEVVLPRADTIVAKGTHGIPVEGIAGSHDIALEWEKFPDAVTYLVFAAAEGGDASLVAKTDRPQCVIGPFRGSVGYRIYLCYIDAVGSLFVQKEPVRFETENSLPSIPANLASVKGLSDTYSLTWDPAQDDDGSIVRYDVYIKKDATFVKMGSSDWNGFVTPSLYGSGPFVFAVRAIDNKGAVSGISEAIPSRQDRVYGFNAEMVMYFPVRSLRDSYTYGYGARIGVTRKGIFAQEVSIGCAVAANHFAGKGERKADLFPVLISCSYERPLGGGLLLGGRLDGGASYFGGRNGAGKSFQRYLPTGVFSLQAGYVTGRARLFLSAGTLALYDRGTVCLAVEGAIGASISIGY